MNLSEKETLTIWMKSLVCQGNGFTVFNSNGDIVYRIDNYGETCRHEVYLMDLKGKVLFTIFRKKFGVFRHWDGYRDNGINVNEEKPWFQVRKNWKISNNSSRCRVTKGCGFDNIGIGYRIVGLQGKSDFKIVNCENKVVAEVKQKQTSSGIILGNDVLSLVVEAHVDQSLIMAIVAVYELINHRM